ncbi:hypothetical protein HD597_003426 [Nonomuraea thailandensis]|uniref:Uncharacterized protein n=1 Tax=Nonomuraea thailandensis TaxID=1188745 RepID=A0A9X2GCI1_9ACTN|nr:DUF6313 family protein [Nonomuraea thailandensis]MCP2356406.1 hypothetical protein [Nonomuraea thailandensis]
MTRPSPSSPAPGSPGRPLRRRWAAGFGGLANLARWLWREAKWLIIGVVVLFVATGLLIGWVEAYEILMGFRSPSSAKHSILAWALSVVGWAIIPALIGAVVGYLWLCKKPR